MFTWIPLFQLGTRLCTARAALTQWEISSCCLTRWASNMSFSSWLDVSFLCGVTIWIMYETAHKMANVFFYIVYEPVAVPAVPPWSCPPDGTEDVSAHGRCRLSGALQKVSSPWSGAPPTPSAHILHLACSPSTRMAVHQEEWRREVTNSITGVGVGVFILIPLPWKSKRTLDGNSESRMLVFLCVLCFPDWGAHSGSGADSDLLGGLENPESIRYLKQLLQ